MFDRVLNTPLWSTQVSTWYSFRTFENLFEFFQKIHHFTHVCRLRDRRQISLHFKASFIASGKKIQKYLQCIYNSFITNKLSLQLEAWSDCDKFTIITILPFYSNNDILTWDTEREINIIKVTMLIINQTVPREMSKYLCSKPVFHVILTKIPSIVI